MCRRERTIRDTFRRKEVRCEEVEGEVKRKGVQMGVLARTGASIATNSSVGMKEKYSFNCAILNVSVVNGIFLPSKFSRFGSPWDVQRALWMSSESQLTTVESVYNLTHNYSSSSRRPRLPCIYHTDI